MTHALCYIGSDSPEFMRIQAGKLQPCERQQARQLVIIVDVADETQVVSSMPLVRGSGNIALLRQRRLEREFPAVALKAALPYRNRPNESLTDMVLMSTDSTGSLSRELATLGEDCIVRGIFTPAMLAAHWMRRAGLHDRKVLITMPTPAGLRLMYVDQCCPLLSRLVPRMASDGLATELGRTIQYLHNSQRLSREDHLELWFWGMDEEQVQSSMPTADNCELAAAPRSAGLPDPETDGFDALLQLAAASPPTHQLAPHSIRAGWYARQFQRWGLGAVAATLLCGAVVTWWMYAGATQFRRELADVLANDASYQDQRRSIEEQLAGSGLGIEELLSLPRVSSALEASAVHPEEALRLAASVLGARNEVMVQSIEFQSGSTGSEAPGTTGGCTNEAKAGAPVFEASFRLLDGLDVRTRAETIGHVRKAVSSAGRWQSTPSTSTIGDLQPVAAVSSAQGSDNDAEWLTCLWRETAS